jgi:hypothetical protein
VKPEIEFRSVEEVPWTPCAGGAEGLYERVLAKDEESGVATRILRFDPGADSSPNGVQVHDFWEELYIISGELRDLTLDETFTAGMQSCRPPGMEHGPWISETGCEIFEVRYLANSGPGGSERGEQ